MEIRGEEVLKQLILKYTGINVKNIDENLLDLPVYGEIWLYIICEAEEKYNFPLLSVIETIESRDFTLRILVEKLKIQQTALKLK